MLSAAFAVHSRRDMAAHRQKNAAATKSQFSDTTDDSGNNSDSSQTTTVAQSPAHNHNHKSPQFFTAFFQSFQPRPTLNSESESNPQNGQSFFHWLSHSAVCMSAYPLPKPRLQYQQSMMKKDWWFGCGNSSSSSSGGHNCDSSGKPMVTTTYVDTVVKPDTLPPPRKVYWKDDSL